MSIRGHQNHDYHAWIYNKKKHTIFFEFSEMFCLSAFLDLPFLCRSIANLAISGAAPLSATR